MLAREWQVHTCTHTCTPQGWPADSRGTLPPHAPGSSMSSWYTTKERKALDVQGVVNLSPQVISTSLIPSAAEWNQGFRIQILFRCLDSWTSVTEGCRNPSHPDCMCQIYNSSQTKWKPTEISIHPCSVFEHLLIYFREE